MGANKLGGWENSQMFKKIQENQWNNKMRSKPASKSSSSSSSSDSSSSSSSEESNKSKSKNNRNAPYRGLTFNHVLQTTKDKQNRSRQN